MGKVKLAGRGPKSLFLAVLVPFRLLTPQIHCGIVCECYVDIYYEYWGRRGSKSVILAEKGHFWVPSWLLRAQIVTFDHLSHVWALNPHKFTLG